MVISYQDFGDNIIFNEDSYDLKNEYRVTKKNDFGLLQGVSVFGEDGGNHEIKITKDDIASCKVEFSTAGCLEIESDKLVANMEMGAVLQKDPGTISVSGDYVMENWRSKTTVDAALKGDLSLSNETVISSDGVSVGVSFKVDKTAGIVDYNAAVNWEVDENSTYSAHTEKMCDNLHFTCVKKVGAEAEVAGRLSFDCESRTTNLNFGAKNPLFGGHSQWLLGNKAIRLLYSKKISENVEGEFLVNYPVSRGFGGITHGFRLAFS